MKIVFLVVLILNVAFGGEVRFDCPEDNIVYGYSDDHFDSVLNVASWENCGRICNLTTLCNFWSWGQDGSGSTCYLYETDTGLDFNDVYTSGERGCPQDQECKGGMST